MFLPAIFLLLPGNFSERQIRPYGELGKYLGLPGTGRLDNHGTESSACVARDAWIEKPEPQQLQIFDGQDDSGNGREERQAGANIG